jgi:uncharacterized integral membrane protein
MANERDRGHRVYRGTGFYASVVAALAISAALLIFAVQNTGSVTIEWLGFDMTAPLFAWGIGAALLAVAVDELVGLIWRARERGRLNRQSRAEESEEEMATNLESTPDAPSAADLTQETHRYDESRR